MQTKSLYFTRRAQEVTRKGYESHWAHERAESTKCAHYMCTKRKVYRGFIAEFSLSHLRLRRVAGALCSQVAMKIVQLQKRPWQSSVNYWSCGSESRAKKLVEWRPRSRGRRHEGTLLLQKMILSAGSLSSTSHIDCRVSTCRWSISVARAPAKLFRSCKLSQSANRIGAPEVERIKTKLTIIMWRFALEVRWDRDHHFLLVNVGKTRRPLTILSL
jgi:hypothetical protein